MNCGLIEMFYTRYDPFLITNEYLNILHQESVETYDININIISNSIHQDPLI
jgi:hypothetical protein